MFYHLTSDRKTFLILCQGIITFYQFLLPGFDCKKVLPSAMISLRGSPFMTIKKFREAGW